MAHCEEADTLWVEMPPALRLCVDSANIMDVIVDFFPVESREVRNPADLAGMPCMHDHPGFRRAHTRRPGCLVLLRWCCGDASSQQKEGWSCFYVGEATLCRVSDSGLQGPPRAGSDVAGGTILRGSCRTSVVSTTATSKANLWQLTGLLARCTSSIFGQPMMAGDNATVTF